MRGRLKEWMLRLILLTVSCAFALGMVEVMVRVFFPISDGLANVTLDGKPITGWFEPGSVYRQVSSEYDAVTTITDKGHRVPGADGNPEVIFIGDSFTYGFGLNDNETFASIYCTELHRACANLGIPGSGTLRQLERLESFLDKYGWHPREVKLFFFGMSTSWSSGNDFVDNYERYMREHAAKSAAAAAPAAAAGSAHEGPSVSMVERLIGLQTVIPEHSVLMRRVKFFWGPQIKSLIVADPGEYRMNIALTATRENLQRLDELSHRFGFDYTIYLLPTVQDILRGTDGATLAALSGVSPRPVVAIADVFRDAPKTYSYGLDGHLNPKGARRVAELLIAQDRRQPSSASH
jgi:hypothetical protein